METKDTLLGQRFNHSHAAGVTRYQVDRKHRDVGYYECVAVRCVEGTHTFLGGIQVFCRADILTALGAPAALACECYAPDRSGRTCDKPRGHDGAHWTYGGATLTWERGIDDPITRAVRTGSVENK